MSFRQHNKDADTAWRRRTRAALIAAGLPDVVAEDERRWNYVLHHGADEFETGWSPRWITTRQAANMLSLLQAHYQHQAAGLELCLQLKRRIGAG
jgi:hypothetical protein